MTFAACMPTSSVRPIAGWVVVKEGMELRAGTVDMRDRGTIADLVRALNELRVARIEEAVARSWSPRSEERDRAVYQERWCAALDGLRGARVELVRPSAWARAWGCNLGDQGIRDARTVQRARDLTGLRVEDLLVARAILIALMPRRETAEVRRAA